MTYAELEEHLVFFDTTSKDYEKYRKGKTEDELEKAGFVSGHLYETHEILLYALSDSKENFQLICQFLENHCPNSFSIMIANLDSNPNKYETLYDLCEEINFVKEDNFEFPIDCLKKIRIYK